jgi:hypothetical protein
VSVPVRMSSGAVLIHTASILITSTDHRSSSRNQAAQPSAAAAGQVMFTQVAPRFTSM